MEKIAKQLTDLIGGTPLLELSNYEKKKELRAQVVAKLEYFNPLGSVKDRVANAMIEQGRMARSIRIRSSLSRQVATPESDLRLLPHRKDYI